MKTRLISAAVAAVIAVWASAGSARETVALPGVVGATGVLTGVDTTGGGTLTVAPGQNINTSGDPGGGIRQSAGSVATITFVGGSAVTGAVGAPTLPLFTSPVLKINAGATATTVTFGAKVFTTTLNVTGTGTVNFNGDTTAASNFAADGFINLGATKTLIGALITATAGTGTLTLNGGSTVIGAIGGASGVKSINVVGGNAAITGAVQSLGFNLGANTLAITGALTTNAGGSIATTLTSNTLPGNGNITSAASNYLGPGITVVPTVGGTLTTGTIFQIVNGTSTATAGKPITVTNTNPRYTFTGAIGGVAADGDVNITLTTIAPLGTIVTTPGAVAVAPVLDVPAAPGSDLAVVQNAIAALPAAPAINSALAQLSPGTANLAAPRVAGQATRLFDDLWMARVDEIQDLCCDTCEPNKAGLPANAHKCKGSEQRGNWWGKGFDNVARQGDFDNMSGYHTKAFGAMLAYDAPLNNATRIGLGGGYAHTTIDGNNSTGSARINSYQLTGYVSHTPGPWYVQGALTAGVDKYDGSRPIAFAGVNRVANADYTGQQYSALVSTGRHFYFNDAITVTPLAALQVSRVHVGSYTENGAGALNLQVNSQDYTFVQSSLGVKAERVIQSGSGTYSPEAHFKWFHDFSSTTMQQTATFTGGGAAFTTEGLKQNRELFNVGAGLTFLSCKCGDKAWTVKGLYDYKWNQNSYSSHQVSIVASLKF